jgi:hypothetical protein
MFRGQNQIVEIEKAAACFPGNSVSQCTCHKEIYPLVQNMFRLHIQSRLISQNRIGARDQRNSVIVYYTEKMEPSAASVRMTIDKAVAEQAAIHPQRGLTLQSPRFAAHTQWKLRPKKCPGHIESVRATLCKQLIYVLWI